LSSTCLVSLFQWYADTRDLHSFPTRRSSDLRRHHDTVVGGRHLERVEVRVGRRPRAWLGEVDAPREAPVDDRERHAVDAHLGRRSEEHTSELQSRENLVCRLLLEKKKKKRIK